MSLGRVRSQGFTLLELMAVLAIIGTLLLLVPANLDFWGTRSRLEASANSLVAALAFTRTQAIEDGYDAVLELAAIEEEGEKRAAYRIRFTNIPAARPGENEDEAAERARQRTRERVWLTTTWHTFPSGIVLAGTSDARGDWSQPSAERPFMAGFTAAGNVDRAVAIRLENADMEVARENRTVTVFVNALTSEASWQPGLQELEPQRPAAEFGL